MEAPLLVEHRRFLLPIGMDGHSVAGGDARSTDIPPEVGVEVWVDHKRWPKQANRRETGPEKRKSLQGPCIEVPRLGLGPPPTFPFEIGLVEQLVARASVRDQSLDLLRPAVHERLRFRRPTRPEDATNDLCLWMVAAYALQHADI